MTQALPSLMYPASTSHVQSASDVAPGPVVVLPVPQLAQDESSRKYPASQMHSEAEVAPSAAVIPFPQLTQAVLDGR